MKTFIRKKVGHTTQSNISIQNNENQCVCVCVGGLFPMFLIQEHLSLGASRVLECVCTVIRTVAFYAWTSLHSKGIYLLKLDNQEVSKSVNHATE